MPRIARKNLTGNIFHVITQGINKENIFFKSEFKNRLKTIIKEEIKNYKIGILAYCIMDNHTHILLKVQKINDLSEFMHNVNCRYARYYNKICNRVGYVFRDRYYVKTIRNHQHLLACFTYIHKNPINAKIVKKEEEYLFSSYNEYCKDRFLINNNAIKYMFETTDKKLYLNQFYSIHKYFYEEKIMDIEDNFDYERLIKKCREDKIDEKTIVIKLYNEYNLTQTKIAQLLDLTRNNIRKYLKK